MKVLPILIFFAAAGVGSNLIFFNHVSQLNYQNAMLTFQVNSLERKLAHLHKTQSLQTHKMKSRNSLTTATELDESLRVSHRSRYQ